MKKKAVVIVAMKYVEISIGSEKIVTTSTPWICHEIHACNVPNMAKKVSTTSIQIAKAFLEVNANPMNNLADLSI